MRRNLIDCHSQALDITRLLAWCGSLLLVLHSVSAQTDPTFCDVDFGFSAKDENAIRAQYEASLVRISCKTKRGTGFLIENSAGYIMTAHHVVADCIDNGNEPATGVFSTFNLEGEPFGLAYVTGDKDADLAVLRTTGNKPIASAREYPITVHAPFSGGKAIAFGYPVGKQSPFPSTGLLTNEGDGKYSWQETTLRGDSGGPVFNDSGRVIAVMTDNFYEDQFGEAHSISLISDKLMDKKIIASTLEVTDLVQKVRAGQIKASSLIAKLKADDPASISNFELMMLVRDLAGETNVSSESHQPLWCIVDASIARGINLTKELAAMLESIEETQLLLSPSVNDVLLSFGKKYKGIGDEGAAQVAYMTGLKLVDDDIQRELLENPTVAFLPVCEELRAAQGSMNIPGTFTVEIPDPASALKVESLTNFLPNTPVMVNCGAMQDAGHLSKLTNTKAELLLLAADVSDDNKEGFLADANAYAKFATVLSANDAQKGRNFALAADVAAARGKYKDAAAWYRSAWQVGNKDVQVSHDYVEALVRAGSAKSRDINHYNPSAYIQVESAFKKRVYDLEQGMP